MLKAAKTPKRLHSQGTPTGIRRFFFKLELLRKRRPNLPYDYSNLDPVVDTPPASDKKPPPSYPRSIPPSTLDKENQNPALSPAASPAFNRPAVKRVLPKGWSQYNERVALINEDHSEEAVVVTTLNDVPFCCHEDLLTMSRESLIGVALSLNASLPHAMAIDIDHVIPTSFIRSSIERIVGLRGDAPQAPKALRLLTDSEGDKRLIAEWRRRQNTNTPPTSPLARRSQSHGQLTSLMSPRLARLAEEDERENGDDDVDMDVADLRLQKKRKLSFDRGGSDDEAKNEEDSDVDMLSGPQQSSPTPLLRMQRTRSQYVVPKTRISPSPVRILRSQSQKLARPTTTDVRDTAFMYDKRPVARYQRRTTRAASGDTKIPMPIGAPRKNGRLRPIAANAQATQHAPVTGRATKHDAPFSALLSEVSSTSSVEIGAKRKRGGGRIDSEKQVTSGMRRMNMEGHGVESDAMDTGP